MEDFTQGGEGRKIAGEDVAIAIAGISNSLPSR